MCKNGRLPVHPHINNSNNEWEHIIINTNNEYIINNSNNEWEAFYLLEWCCRFSYVLGTHD